MHREYANCTAELQRYLALPTATWKEERAAAYRHISQCHNALASQHDEGTAERAAEYVSAQHAALQGVVESLQSGRQDRDAWLQLAFASRTVLSWQTAYWAAKKALEITEYQPSSFETGHAWGAEPLDELAQAAYALGFYVEAAAAGEKAAALQPGDERLVSNLEFYREKAEGQQAAEPATAADADPSHAAQGAEPSQAAAAEAAPAALSASQEKMAAALRKVIEGQQKVTGWQAPLAGLGVSGRSLVACRRLHLPLLTPTLLARCTGRRAQTIRRG